MADPRPGDRFGTFEIAESLGRGGNATVFRAIGPDGDAAVKILNSRRVDSEPYARFRREIETLRELGDRPGVLPLLDASLPETLGKGERAWLAMPLATPIAEALQDAELPAIVEAIASIAATLAELHANSGLAHRDIKPQNLYRRGEEFAVGDFGLVALPDAEHLTAPGKVIGPANFVAYEMMERPLEADPAPGDVYSLAKTLWVLATGSRWPPPGHQPAGQSPSIGGYRPHVHAAQLDELIDRATRLNAEERPSMASFAADLRLWLETPPPAPELAGLAAIGEELRRRAAPHVEAAAAVDRRHAAAYRLSERLEQRLAPTTRVLSESFPNFGSADGGWLAGTAGTPEAFGEPTVEIRHAVGGTLTQFADFDPLLLRYGALVELLEHGRVRVTAAISLANRDSMGGGSDWVGEAVEASVDSLAAERAVDAAADDLAGRLPEWVQAFAHRTP